MKQKISYQVHPLRHCDIMELGTIRNSQFVHGRLRQIDFCTEETQEAWYNKYVSEKKDKVFVLKEHKGKKEKVIGQCHLLNIDKYHNTAEVGWFIKEEYSKKGLMFEAVMKMLKYAFTDLGLLTVYATVYENNIKGIAFCQKLKMKYVGNFSYRKKLLTGEYISELIYELTNRKFFE